MIRYGFLFALIIMLIGCSAEDNKDTIVAKCVNCHILKLDAGHQHECTSCHKGQSNAQEKSEAHIDLVRSPAHPDQMTENCASCHGEIIEAITSTEHFTLKNSTNLFRKAFGADTTLKNFRDVVQAPFPNNGLELADDLLRRRCFRCHLYDKGDAYPATAHGTGCAACHLEYEDGKLISHAFMKPSDQQCLTCHYGNNVGFDYYGRFEHDFNNEYRTPYTTTEKYFRPYGVEYRELRPDIHKLKGMSCVDCHTGKEIMYGSAEKVTCKSCHQEKEFKRNSTLAIKAQGQVYVFTSRSGTVHNLPLLQHPAHFTQQTPVACQACHAQWTFYDTGRHFIRMDSDDLDDWFNLSIQGSAEVETIIENNTDYDKDELPVQMSDKLTGQYFPGLWLKGFTQRRWEIVELRFDKQGVLSPVRPVLDYQLSWMDEEETVHFDSITPLPETDMLLPYVPHTTGSAGAFYQERLEQAIKKLSQSPVSK